MGGVERAKNWKRNAALGTAAGIGAVYGGTKLYGAYKAAEYAEKMKELSAPLQMISLFGK